MPAGEIRIFGQINQTCSTLSTDTRDQDTRVGVGTGARGFSCAEASAQRRCGPAPVPRDPQRKEALSWQEAICVCTTVPRVLAPPAHLPPPSTNIPSNYVWARFFRY